MYEKIQNTKHEDVLAIMGSIVGTGILNAAGGNATI